MNADRADRDPVRFWYGVISSIQRIEPAFGTELFDRLTWDGRVCHDTIESLAVELAGMRRMVLVVDDFQHVADDVAGHLDVLEDRGLGGLRLVIGSRVEPSVRVGRLRMAGRVTEVREADLLLGEVEVRALVQALGLQLEPDEIQLLLNRTEGWVAGVKLAVLAMRNASDQGRFLHRLAGSNAVMSEYLSAEVIDAQDPPVRDFLLDTCIVDELTAGLAMALAPGSPVTIDQLERANLMVVRVDGDGGVYRYHHLFAEMLRHRLRARQPDRELLQHQRAAGWFERHGDPLSAFRHLWLAGDRLRGMDLVTESVIPTFFTSGIHGIKATLGALGDDDLAAAPGLTIGLAMGLVLEGFAEEALDLACRIRDRYFSDLDDDDRVRLAATLGLIEVNLGRPEDYLAELSSARKLYDDHPASDWTVVGMTMAVRAACWTGDPRQIDSLAPCLDLSGPRKLERVDNVGSIAHTRLVMGDLEGARDLALEALAFLATYPEEEPSIQVLPRALLGTALLELGDASAALSEFELALSHRPEVRRPAHTMARLGISRIHASEGMFDAALASLEAARSLLERARRGTLQDLVDLRTARLLIAVGETQRAADLIDSVALTPHQVVARAMLARALGRADRGTELLETVVANDLPPGIRLDTILARIGCMLDQGDHVESETQAAVDLVDAHGFVFAVAEAGGAVLLEVCSQARRQAQSHHIKRLLLARAHATSADQARADFAIDLLSERERTVLRYLVTAMTYREIADELYVSVNTVKTHVKNIIRKLHATSRQDAMERARELGYL